MPNPANATIFDEIKTNILAEYDALLSVDPGREYVLAVSESFDDSPLPGQNRVGPQYLAGWVLKTDLSQFEYADDRIQCVLLPYGEVFDA